ncbi:hypothetical protein FNF27_06624 [Cafeteria roenbergensis]|uniref:J domain-containing protein n=2 Tax=Cafeteria roenbergensis TaxID=33653 RepID=A0A5A8DLY9_CAFRO|nr:hypothetical protein FNF31_01681 [Cafeteria roenbergensis]KAA0166661.1 hypothetical protein FNF28_03035 [Cafeteria roenbergensis]KAA0170367.1 hypothetical protein FNF27_06624 [Cafeteria roenbergensis]CAE7948320.1 Dnajc9 [Symbiodinium sp. KB8]
MSGKLLDSTYGTRDLYEVLGVARDAGAGAIRKAYLRAALKVHPDKEGGDADKFRALTLAYEVLHDPERREAFDRDGDIIDDAAGDEESASEAQWSDYWRSMFARVSVEAIEEYKASYPGGKEEEEDALAAYEATGGCLEDMMSCIIAEDDEAEERVSAVISRAIAAGTLKPMGDFAAAALREGAAGAAASAAPRLGEAKAKPSKHGGRSSAAGAAPKGSKGARRKAAKRDNPSGDDGMAPDLVAAIQASRAKRAALGRSEAAEAAEAARELGLGEGMSGLELAIAQRNQARGGFLGSLAARYGVSMDSMPEGEEGRPPATKGRGKRGKASRR